MNMMSRIVNSLPQYWEVLKSYLSPGSREESEEEASDEPPSKRRRMDPSDSDLLGLPKPEIPNVARNRMHYLYGEATNDDFLLCSRDRAFNFPVRLKRKSRLESPVTPNSRYLGTPCSATEKVGKENVIYISDDENKDNDDAKKNCAKEEIYTRPDANAVHKPNAECQNPLQTSERASWLDARSTCRVFGRKEMRADKENDAQQLKVVAPSFLEKRNFPLSSEFHGKYFTPAMKAASKPEMSGGGGSSSLKRPNSSSLNYLSNSQTSLCGRKLQLLDQSIRLDEREKYSELLQSYTRIPVMKHSSFQARRERSPPLSLASHSRRKYGGNVEVIDLTNQAENKEDGKKSGIVTEKPGISTALSEPPPSIELRKKLQNSSAFDVSWIDDLSKMYSKRDREVQKQLFEEKMKAALCTKKSEQMLNEILEERVRVHLRLTEVAVEEGPMPVAEDEIPLPELTPEMEKRISYAFRSGPGNETLAEGFSLRITRRDLHTLVGTNWLNDEVINFYMNLLIERGKLDNYPTVYCFNTFFYPKLETQGHASLKRWTRRIDIFANELLIVPVHLGVHWCLACINLKEKRILYFDSMGGNNNTCLQNLMKYLQDESMDKKKQKFDTRGWSTENVKDNPQQMNGSDCGMFSCMYAEYLCRRAKFNFSQSDMPYFRRKMAYEILSKKLLL